MKTSLRLDEIAAMGGGYGVPAGWIKIMGALHIFAVRPFLGER